MNGGRVAAIIWLELTQRVRSVAWYVLLGVCGLLLAIVTALSFAMWSYAPQTGAGVYSVVVFFALLLAVLVSPTLSGNAINGDRDAATLAPVQVTLATTGEIIAGKFIAAWTTGLAFVVVAAPFLVTATLAGGVSALVVVTSLVVLIVEIGVVAAIGVGLSGILARPLFSVAVTYLVVAALAVGTPIAFGLGGAAVRTEVEYQTRTMEPVYPQGMPTVPPECMTAAPGQTEPLPECMTLPPFEQQFECGEWSSYTSVQPRFDLVWWVLAANPFVILADATPAEFDQYGSPVDMFGGIKASVRGAQIPPESVRVFDDCAPGGADPYPTAEEISEQATPSWFVGLAVQLVLAAGLLAWAWARTRTPARRLPPGTRIA